MVNSDPTENSKEVVSSFRRALPQFCIVGVKNLILLGKSLLAHRNLLAVHK